MANNLAKIVNCDTPSRGGTTLPTKIKLQNCMYVYIYSIYYIVKSIGSPPSNERFDYFSNFYEYKS